MQNNDNLNQFISNGFKEFIINTFNTVSPGEEFLDNWHIDLIAYKLEQARIGKIKRLIINMPPRALKSICISVAWPAWILGNDPTAKIMAASYSKILSIKHSLDCRVVINSPWYKQQFPQVEVTYDQNEKSKFTTTKRGFRFATSVLGTATGEGGDFLIVDDPLSPMQALSEATRTQANKWFEQTFVSRLNNKKNGVIVILMQRLHPEDLTGYLLKKQPTDWEVLTLPSVAEKEMKFTIEEKPFTHKEGECLHSTREGNKEIERAKLELGSYAFASQYQQSPLVHSGALINLTWLKNYEELPEEVLKITQSWDTAVKIGAKNDYSVCTTWGETSNGYYLLDVQRAKLSYPALKRTVISLAEQWQPHAILIEDKASGESLIQDLRSETKLPIIAIKPTQDKLSRFIAITSIFEAGKVHLPRFVPWKALYEMELTTFPYAIHDDQVDSTTQFLQYAKNKVGRDIRIREL
jgi:predicted phage terminase large subunit-like protein